MEKKYGVMIAVVACVAMLAGALFMYSLDRTLSLHGHVGVDFETSSIHCRIIIYDSETLVLDEYHSGVVTDIGDNLTLAKVFGDADFPVVNYTKNCTYISIGNQGSLSTSSTVLPGEWNRTQGTVEDEIQSQLNITCTFYPDASGPYTADCIGLNWDSTIGITMTLWAYDTFTEVTGIDEDFTINVEFQVGVSHSQRKKV